MHRARSGGKREYSCGSQRHANRIQRTPFQAKGLGRVTIARDPLLRLQEQGQAVFRHEMPAGIGPSVSAIPLDHRRI